MTCKIVRLKKASDHPYIRNYSINKLTYVKFDQELDLVIM